MRAVNLLPRQHVEQKRERPSAVALGAAIGGAAVLLALVGGFLLANRSVNRQRQALAGRDRERHVTQHRQREVAVGVDDEGFGEAGDAKDGSVVLFWSGRR